MKTLVLFYSLGGNTRYVSEILAKELQADMLELKTKKEYPSSGFQKYFWGGKSVVFKEQPELTNPEIHLEPYEAVVIGTPIWAGTFAAPLNTLVKQHPFTGKKVALFACHAGGGTEKCFQMLQQALPGNTFLGTADFIDPLKEERTKRESAEKAARWARELALSGI